jgi:hypothetical protein
MNRWSRIAIGTVGGLVVAGAIGLLVGGVLWNRRTARMVERLGTGTPTAAPVSASASPSSSVATFSPAQLEGLPTPVARYFLFALQPGQPLVRAARVEHAGTFATEPDQWEPFTSVQHFRVRPPAFVWDAAIRMGRIPPMLGVRVRDSYLDGEGAMYGAVAALVPVADQQGTPEIASGSLARFLAESVWFPTALLPGRAGAGVTWSPVDDSTAKATLVDGARSVSADFHFSRRGEIVRVSGERFRDVAGKGVMTPWTARLREYSRRNGMMVPAFGEVAWLTAEGRRPYWRGNIARVAYEWR